MTQLFCFIGGQLFLFIPKKRKQKTDMLKLSKYCWRQKGNPNYDNQKNNTPLMLGGKKIGMRKLSTFCCQRNVIRIIKDGDVALKFAEKSYGWEMILLLKQAGAE